ncbi:MAG TPA: hypothetical protein VK754_02025 [Propionibacteriaceae bacterium]|nr:hypothetical protein [Propionibacteriaceae bacterium]
MTATETPTIQTESSPPPAAPPAPRRRRRVLLGAGLAVLAVVALIAWLLAMSSETQTRPVAPASAVAPPQQAESAAGQASAGSNAGAVESSDSYAQFCQNSPVLCSPAPPPAPNAGYVQFCHNSPALCTVAKPN